jgi:hypothetical protein
MEDNLRDSSHKYGCRQEEAMKQTCDKYDSKADRSDQQLQQKHADQLRRLLG